MTEGGRARQWWWWGGVALRGGIRQNERERMMDGWNVVKQKGGLSGDG